MDFIRHLLDRLAEVVHIGQWVFEAALVIFIAVVAFVMVRAVWRAIKQFGRWVARGVSAFVHWAATAVGAVATAWNNAARGMIRVSLGWMAYEPGDRSLRIVRRSKVREAERAIADRRRFVSAVLRGGFSSDGPQREVPPSFETPSQRPSPDPEGSRAAHLARCRWELGADALLLQGRASDAVKIIAAMFQKSHPDRGTPTIDVSLRERSWWQCWVGEYPWIVEIGTDERRFFLEHLQPIAEWLGITVALAKPMRLRLHKACVPAPQSAACGASCDGTVAASVMASDAVFLLTCAHVTPPGCIQHHVRSPFEQDPGQPDAMLLRAAKGCQRAAHSGTAMQPATHAEISAHKDGKGAVWKTGSQHDSSRSIIKFFVSDYTINGIGFNFPAFLVRFRAKRYFWMLPWPFWRFRFSVPGDSGSQVFAQLRAPEAKLLWLGMLHAGEGRDSIVLAATPLVDYIAQRLGTRSESVSVKQIDLKAK